MKFSNLVSLGLIGALSCVCYALSSRVNQLEDEANTDHLTGVLNRRSFSRLAVRVLQRQEEQSGQSVLVFADINKFKDLNEQHGYDGGDTILRLIAQELVNVCRPMDLVCRFGGDEFVILMPGVMVEDMESFAQRIEQRIQAATQKHFGVTVTTSYMAVNAVTFEDVIYEAGAHVQFQKAARPS